MTNRPLAAIPETLIAFADYWADKAENARFMAMLRGPREDEPEMAYVRLFVNDIDALVAEIRHLAAALAEKPPQQEEK